MSVQVGDGHVSLAVRATPGKRDYFPLLIVDKRSGSHSISNYISNQDVWISLSLPPHSLFLSHTDLEYTVQLVHIKPLIDMTQYYHSSA